MTTKKSDNEWEKMFKAADADGSGMLDVKELRNLLRKGNSNMADSQIADAFVFFDGPKGDKMITFEEFKRGLQALKEFVQKLNALFKQFDSDNSGCLDKNELRKILESCGQKFTDAEVNEILKKADKSGDGKITFDEFMEACT